MAILKNLLGEEKGMRTEKAVVTELKILSVLHTSFQF